MRVLKNILIGFGILFLVIAALATWIGVSSRQFRNEQAPFVQAFVTDLSKRWEALDVYDRMTVTFIEQADTPQAHQLLGQFKELGRLRSVQDLELQSYTSTNGTQTGVFSFKGTFEYGEGAAKLTILKKNGEVRAQSFSLNAIHIRAGSARVQT